MQETVRDQDEMEWLKLDYQMCHAGYNSRDQITEDEFSKLVQVFSIFLTVIVAVNVFVKVNTFLHIVLCIVIGVSGFLSMISFLIDLESASSCKIEFNCKPLVPGSCIRLTAKSWSPLIQILILTRERRRILHR